MKKLTIPSQYERPAPAANRSIKTLTPACEGIFDLFKRSKVEKEVRDDPSRISTSNKSTEQLLLTVRHYLTNPEAYTFHGEKVTVNTKIFGGKPGSLNLQAILTQLETLSKSWYRDYQTASRFATDERKVREKHTESLKKEFWDLTKTNPNDAGEVFYETKIKGMMNQFFPNGATAYGEGKLKFTDCHAGLWEYETYDAPWGKTYSLANALYEKVDVSIPALNQATGERLFKILMSFAKEKDGAITLPEIDKAFDTAEQEQFFFPEKAMHRTCESGDASWAYSVIWNSDGDSAEAMMDDYANHVYDVVYAWAKIAVSSLKRNPNIALEEYYDHTPACEGFVDIIRAGVKKFTDRGDKREKHKLVANQYGGMSFNPKQQSKMLRDIVNDALADTYNDPKWVEKNVDNTSSMYDHPEMGYLYAGKRLVKLEDLVGEFKKIRGFLDDIRRREQPFIDIRETVLKKVHEIDRVGGAELRVKLAVELYDKHKDKLESFVGSRISTAVAKYEAVGCEGPLFIHNPPSYNFYHTVRGKSYEYPIPSKENYKTYIEVLNALIAESEDFDTWWKAERPKVLVSYFEFLPEFIWDDVEHSDHSEYYDLYISNVTKTQSREELGDFYFSYQNQLAEAIIAVYHLLFNAQKLNPANEGLVDFFKEMFSNDTKKLDVIASGTKDSKKEIQNMIQKTYNNPSWVAKVPDSPIGLKADELGYLFYDGKQITDGDELLAKARELFTMASGGLTRLAKTGDIRWDIIRELGHSVEEHNFKDKIHDKKADIEKIFKDFASYYKPTKVIGSSEPWFTPTNLPRLAVPIAPFNGDVKSISKGDVIKLRDQIPKVVDELTKMIATLSEDACDGHSPGSIYEMLTDDESVMYTASELSQPYAALVVNALFDGEGPETDVAGTAPAVATRASYLLSHVLKAYLTWAFKRA